MKIFRTKVPIVASLLILVLIFVSACGGAQEAENGGGTEEGNDQGTNAEAGKPVIGLAAIDLSNPFFVQMKEAGDQAAEDYGVNATWQSADGSVENQISIIENFIQQEVDVILIDPLDINAVKSVIEQAKEAGIPVITMGNKVEGDWNYNTLYPDYENMGMVARVLGTAMDGTGQIALLSLSKGNYVSDSREAGFIDIMEERFPDIEVVGNHPTNFDPADAQSTTETWLNNYPDLKAIGFSSDPLGLAAMSAAEGHGKELFYGGYDGDPVMHPYIEDGSMLIDVLTGSYRVGYWNIAVAARIAQGTELRQDLYMPTYYVTSDETAAMLEEKGLEFDYITPEEAEQVALNYAEEFGPDVPDERISHQ